MTNKPTYICLDCGNKASKSYEECITTMHEAKCDICSKKTGVCHVRSFGFEAVEAVDEYFNNLNQNQNE